MKKDNSTLRLKASLRRNLLAEFKSPLILETHGGFGRVYDLVYGPAGLHGIVIEKSADRAIQLARQRPTWAVYEADSERSIAQGLVDGWDFDVVDIDPYGSPWPVIDALLSRQGRNWPMKLGMAVNDGLRQKLRITGGWEVKALEGVIERYGNTAPFANYLAICRGLMEEKTGQLGYKLTRWAGYYCGHRQGMTHYAAVLEMGN